MPKVFKGFLGKEDLRPFLFRRSRYLISYGLCLPASQSFFELKSPFESNRIYDELKDEVIENNGKAFLMEQLNDGDSRNNSATWALDPIL